MNKIVEEAGKVAVKAIITAIIGIVITKTYNEIFDKENKEEIRLKKAKADLVEEMVKQAKDGKPINTTKML